MSKPPMTINECQAARYLNAEGYSTTIIAGFIEVKGDTVARHVRGDCDCPDITRPMAYGTIKGDELKRRRAEANLSMREMAEAVGVARSTVAMWESGQNTPKNKHAVAIEAALTEGVFP